MRIAVLGSREGSNLRAILDDDIPVWLFVTDKPSCKAAKIARTRGIPVIAFTRTWGPEFEEHRERFTKTALEILVNNRIDLVVMAGFMTILSPVFFEQYPDRVINIHPSRLPLFPGAHAVRDTLAANPRPAITGSTIHLVGRKVDDSERILFQTTVEVRPDDTEESLTARIKAVEHTMYPAVIRDYMLRIML